MSIRSASIGLEALGANPLRTILSTLGVVIGVAALVSVLALGDGVERFVREQFEQTTSVQAIDVAPKTSLTVDGVKVPGEQASPCSRPPTRRPLLTEVPGRLGGPAASCRDRDGSRFATRRAPRSSWWKRRSRGRRAGAGLGPLAHRSRARTRWSR